MPIYICFLRGINVGAHKRMKMEELRLGLEGLGFSAIKSYIQSGNLVFRSALRLSPDHLSRRIEEMIERKFGFSADVVSRSKAEVEKTLRNNPFLNKQMDAKALHVIFLPEAVTRAANQELRNLIHPPDDARLLGKDVFCYLPQGISQSSLAKSPGERSFLRRGTMRNWNTVCAIARLASELE